MELSNKQIAAYLVAIRVAEKLVEERPEISDLRRQGLSLREIAQELDIADDYSIYPGLAPVSIRYALIGTKEFKGQMSRQEYAKILQQIHSDNGSNAIKGGISTYSNGTGIYAMTEEERKKARRKGGQKSSGGQVSKTRGVGIHAMTIRQRSDAGIEGIIAQGHIPWIDEEKEHAYALAINPLYKKNGNPSWTRITTLLNSIYGNNRSWRAVMNCTKRYAAANELDL